MRHLSDLIDFLRATMYVCLWGGTKNDVKYKRQMRSKGQVKTSVSCVSVCKWFKAFCWTNREYRLMSEVCV